MKQAGLLRVFSSRFRGEADAAIARCGQVRSRILAAPPGLRVLQGLDDISNEVCRVTDALELLRNVVPCPEAAKDAVDTHQYLSEYIFALNADEEVYSALDRTMTEVERQAAAGGVSDEMVLFGRSLKAEFEKGGIRLDRRASDRLQALQGKELELSTVFSQNLTDSAGSMSMPRHEFDLLDPTTTAALSPFRVEPPDSGTVRFSSNDSAFVTVMAYSPDPSVRQHMYTAHHTGIPENREVLNQLINVRHELAQQLGHPSHAHHSTSSLMSKTPENVMSFLDGVADRTAGQARAEMESLSRLKQRDGLSGVIDAWDCKYYQTQAVSLQSQFTDAQVGDYLSVEGCLNALNVLMKSLFNIEMVRVSPPNPDEIWHPSVEKLVFQRLQSPADTSWWTKEGESPPPPPLRSVAVDPTENADNETVVGVCYLDLYQRQGKYANAAHFTVQCGRRPAHAEPQTPIVALVFAFDSPHRPLSMSEVEVMFHEFGHAMHSLLSQTTTQHLSGTRGPLDFVETPSHLWEHFVWNERFMGLYARHRRTGKPMPPSMRRGLISQDGLHRGLDMQNQVFMSAADLELHSQALGSVQDTSDLVGQLRTKYCSYEHVPRTHWETRFGHLVWYGGGYYSYLWSQVYARSLWQQYLERDPLCATAGRHLLDGMLRHGASQDANQMMRQLVGAEPHQVAS